MKTSRAAVSDLLLADTSTDQWPRPENKDHRALVLGKVATTGDGNVARGEERSGVSLEESDLEMKK